MTKATAVLTPGEPVTLPPAGHISFEIEKGQRFKLTQPQGEQVADHAGRADHGQDRQRRQPAQFGLQMDHEGVCQ